MSKVAVALSGGVDSSVTAFLLKQAGHEVIGITANTTNSEDARQVVKNAKVVAEKLDIPFYEFDATKIFQEKVVKYFENSYKSGETPNPCIMCNKYMKWGALFDYATQELGADFVATGHYANIKEENGFYKLYPASDEHKDQLYFLFLLGQDRLKKTLFPLSTYKKDEVRKIAFDNDLPSKSSKESQDICFIKAPMTTKKYLNNLFEPKDGLFLEDGTNKVMGKHTGFWQYTIGQRKGIGLAAPEALYVTKINAEKNIVYVGYKDKLFADSLVLNDVNWSYPQTENEFEALVKIRYNMKAVPAKIKVEDNKVEIKFNEPVSAVAKGQACVIYSAKDGHLLGGAFVK